MNTTPTSTERGIALITTLLIMMLMSALLVGFTAVVMSDQRYRFIDRDRGQAFYAANGGIEKLTADLGRLFLGHVAPTAAQLSALTVTANKPSIANVSFTAPIAAETIPTSSLTRCASPNTIGATGSPGYSIRFCAAPNGNPTTTSTTPIKTGPYEGLIAQQMPYQLDVSAKTATGGEAHLVRTLEAVAIPVFQFGIFSDVDLSFSAAADFDFGGRVHTNGNLYLAETSGATLTLRDKVTAVKEVVRQRLSNGVTISAVGQTGTVKMATSPAAFRNLAATEGSVTDGPTSSQNEPTWHTVSLSAYNSWLRNSRTGARALNLPLITVGGSNPDLIRRPVVNEDSTNPILLEERLFTKASLRVLLSDTAADITGLPGVTSTQPVQLDGNWWTSHPNNGIGTYDFDATHPPIARSPGLSTAVITVGAASGANRTLTIGAGLPAFLKVPATLTVTKGASTWTVGTCTAKTLTTFTCTTSAPAHTVNTTVGSGANVSASIATADRNITVSSPLNATWSSGSTTITVVNTLAFALDSFWVNDDLVSCSGYDTAAKTLTGCTLPSTIANNTTLTTSALSTVGTGTLGGFLKIERGNTDGSWTDVTMQILNYGIGARNLDGADCGDPTPNAILRLQRLRDNNAASCPYAASANSVSTDYWPNVLFDTREAISRDISPGGDPQLGGVIHYIALDAANLANWFRGTAPYNAGTGNLSKTDNGGFTVYFSDRRNNRNATSKETGDYGFEDFVNPGVTEGPPNSTLDAGEDVDASGSLDVYGSIPNYNGVYNSVPPGASTPLLTTARPSTAVNRGVAQVNRPIFFRHALKLINGATLSATGITGLTIASENPVYIQGNWNANATFTGAHAATAVIADTVAVLSNAWNDNASLESPYNADGRPRATDSYYRVAIISGKGPIFNKPGDVAAGSTFGTDGGAHSFLRMLEGGAGTTVHYKGSMATFYYNRQAVGPFKCCGNIVYSVPTRDYTFDIDFLNPALLPPNTPMFRDLNAVGFAQELRPGR